MCLFACDMCLLVLGWKSISSIPALRDGIGLVVPVVPSICGQSNLFELGSIDVICSFMAFYDPSFVF